MAALEGTYLAWLDFRESGIEGVPADFLLKQARVSLNNGRWFGPQGEGFARLTFACPRSLLTEALEKLDNALR